MLKHKIYLTIWLVLFLASAYFFLKSAFAWHSARSSFAKMQNAVLSEMEVDFSKAGEYTAEFNHTSKLSPHGAMLMANFHGSDASHIAEILDEAEAYIYILEGDNELFSSRLLSQYGFSNCTETYDGGTYIGFFRMPTSFHTQKYTIKLEVKKPSQHTNAVFKIISKYHFCGIERIAVMICATCTIVTGALMLIFLSCLFWRIHLIRSVPLKPSGAKIMYLMSVYPRWSETFIRNDIRHLIAEGVHMELFSLFPGNCKMEEGWPEAVILSPYAGWGSEEAMQNGKRSPLRDLPIPRWIRMQISLFKHRQLLNAIVAECKRGGIGHIHAEFADLAALLGAMAAKKAGCSFSVGIHALDIHKLKYPAHAIFDSAKFITVCNQNAAIAFSNACPWAKQRLHIIHHGINLQEWPFIEKRETGDALKIIYCGRLVPKKGVSLLIDALEILVNHAHNAATLEIIGEGPLEDELKAQVASLGLSDCVSFVGRLSQPEIRGLFAKASCLCAPSVVTKDGDMDGVPNVILEAMASGLPVIGTTVGSLSEVITDETAWPVQEAEPHNIADAILDMASQLPETDRRRQNARSHIEFRFDAEKLGKKRAALF